MSSDRKSDLYDDFQRNYAEAKAAEKNNNIAAAKKYYGLACKALYDFAQTSDGEYRQAYMRRVDDLIGKANALSCQETVPNHESNQVNTTKPVHEKPVDPDETQFFAAAIPNETFDDVAGMSSVKDAISTRIIKPRMFPHVYKALDLKPGGGVLMYGPPGTGKTMIAKAIANEVGAVFFDVKCSQIVQKYVGVAERNVRNLFEAARQHEVAIIFFDEFESLGSKRDGKSPVVNRLVPELLSQIDGFTSEFNTLLIIAATNRPWDIDNAFLRPGRFSELLHIPLPDLEARKHILGKAFGGISMEEGINLEKLAEQMDGFSGADVKEFCVKSKIIAASRCIKEHDGNLDNLIILNDDVGEALVLTRSSVQTEDLEALENFTKQFYKM